MFCAEWRVAQAIGSAREHAVADSSPPIAAPACRPSSRRRPQNSVSMPRWSSSIACARTMSRMVMTGNSRPHGLPVFWSVEPERFTTWRWNSHQAEGQHDRQAR